MSFKALPKSKSFTASITWWFMQWILTRQFVSVAIQVMRTQLCPILALAQSGFDKINLYCKLLSSTYFPFL